jgi:g-D-glutamyl-meso-diaminopimelate peptidase
MAGNTKYLLASVLFAVMAAASPVDVYASIEIPAFEAPAQKETGEPGQAITDYMPGGNTTAAAGDSNQAAQAVVEDQHNVSTGGSPVVGAGSSAAEGSSPVVGAGSSAAEGSSPVVGAGSSVAEGSSPVVGAGSSTAGGGSPVIGAGTGSGSFSGGPGMVGPSQGMPEPDNVVPGRIDYFSEPVSNPTVSVVEKYSYESMVSDLEKLKSRYGSHLQVNVIGTSHDGRNIYEAILGNPNAGKHVLIHAGIHAREYMTPLLVMKQLEYGLEFYDRGSYDGQPLSGILQQVAVHFVPMVNPDGISLSQFGLEAIRSEQLRQEIQQCYASDVALGRTSAAFDRYLMYWKANGRGVDLNQNFPAGWELIVGTPSPSYASYKGTGTLSEPETQALANLVNSRKWSATVSYHSMGNIIYWDYEGNRVQQASGEITSLIEISTGYRAAGSSGRGGFKDWTQIKEDPIPGVTIETGSVACPLPLSEYADIWNRNKMVWALVARYAMDH